MCWTGIFIGLVSFFLIGVFHPIVIKAEYYFTKKIWPLFGVVGLILLAISSQIHAVVPSACIAVLGMTCLWSIRELFEQEERVERGWFPRNPNRKNNASHRDDQ